MDSFSTKYDPNSAECHWQNTWDDTRIYKWDSREPRENTFVIDTPPPTVSGNLHMGHIFSYTQTDFIARYQRMKGKTVFYPYCVDNNGLPTERLVENTKNIRAFNMPREEFIRICQDIIRTEEDKYRSLFKSMGLSMDWNQEYRTISDHCLTISQMSFVDLLMKNRVYRKLRPTLWDTIDCTALSQADLEPKLMASTMSEIKFTTSRGEPIIIVTSRPELIPAAVAIFYHPDDKRYCHLKDQYAITPLFDTKIPILSDDMVDMQMGTGLVMCSTFGDQTDIEWWRRHNLPLRIIIGKNGRIENLDANDLPKAKESIDQLTGLNVKNARIKILELLKKENLVGKQQAIEHLVKCGERSKAPVEILVTPQWFIKIMDIKKELLAKAAECQWHPAHMKNNIDQWINGLNDDWCISRQRFFGVPFPVWYSKRAGEEGKIIVPKPEDLPVDPFVDTPKGYDRSEIELETDVMDTWATSSLTPQINSHGISETCMLNPTRHAKLFPADLRPQAHEIIRSWAFYTIAKSYLHENSIPWRNLMISGWCMAEPAKKMNKSYGKVVDPVGLIQKYGSDVVRLWAAGAKLGSDIVYSEDTIKVGNRLVTKLWNAVKFTSPHILELKRKAKPMSARDLVNDKTIYETMDLWILARLTNVIEKATTELDSFEYHNALSAIETFFWRDFCDNYLEFIKGRTYNEAKGAEYWSAAFTLYHVIHALLCLFAPYMPHVTEELYQKLYDAKSVHSRGNWPNIKEQYKNDQMIALGDTAVSILDVVRKEKAKRKTSMKTPISLITLGKIAPCNQPEELVLGKIAPCNQPEELVLGKSRPEIDLGKLESVLGDLSSVTNAKQIIFADLKKTDDNYITEDGSAIVQITME